MKLGPEEASLAFADLLKAYQLEVEALSRRSKLAETAFSQLLTVATQYQSSRKVENGIEFEKLQAEFKDMESELMRMRNQDLTVRRLEGKIREMENQHKTDLSNAESQFIRRKDEVEATFRIQLDRFQTDIQTLQRRNQDLDFQVAELNKTIYNQKSKSDAALQLKQQEINHLSEELESAKEKVDLSAGSASTLSPTLDMYRDLVDKAEERNVLLDKELRDLRHDFEKMRNAASDQKDELQKKIDKLDSDLEQSRNKLTEILNKLSLVASEHGLPTCDGLEILDHMHEKLLEDNIDLNSLRLQLNELLVEKETISASYEKVVHNPDLVNFETAELNTNDTEKMLPILQAQRERLRARVTELETERDILKQKHFEFNSKLSVLSSEKQKLENERNFWKGQSKERRSVSEVEEGQFNVEDNPPHLFSQTRRDVSRTGVEQSVTSLVIWGLANPVTRRAVLAYVLTLHILVFMVLYRLSSFVGSGSRTG